jgi:hypothetical protein
MNTLFLHGMGARPKEWQLTCLLQHGLVPHALHLNYSTCPAFQILCEYVQEHDIQFLVGRSHGGFYAYWLSEEFGIPCLAINPHFSVRSKQFMTPPITARKSPLSMIVLGSDDELVDPDRSLLFLEQEMKEYPHKKIHTKVLDGVGHWLEPTAFAAHLQWALNEWSLQIHQK